MSKPSQRKREKQRKRKVEHKRRLAQPVSLAYSGNKYRSEELVPFYYATETGIFDCFVMTRRKLTDHHVRAALERLIAELRRGPLPEWDPNTPLVLTAGGEVDFLVTIIRYIWYDYVCAHPHPGRDNVIGVVRTILGSIECWGSVSPQSRGYLEYIEDFCSEMGYTTSATPLSSAIEEAPQPRLH